MTIEPQDILNVSRELFVGNHSGVMRDVVDILHWLCEREAARQPDTACARCERLLGLLQWVLNGGHTGLTTELYDKIEAELGRSA